MKKRYRVILFDLDGTLLDSAEGVLEATRYTLSHYGHALPPDEVLRSFIGPPVQEGFQKHLALDACTAMRYADTFRAYYREHALFLARPFSGVCRTLDTLRANGVRLGVATYKREDHARELLAHFDLVRRFDVVRGADAKGRFDKAEIMRRALDELDAASEEALMVGDSVHDARGASELSVDFLGVTYGYGFSKVDEVYRAGGVAAATAPLEVLSALDMEVRA